MPPVVAAGGMGSCPRCERLVGQLHALPPSVVNRELTEALGGAEALPDLEVCGDCVNELVRGAAVV